MVRPMANLDLYLAEGGSGRSMTAAGRRDLPGLRGRSAVQSAPGDANRWSADRRSSSHQPFGTTMASAWRRHSRPWWGSVATNASNQDTPRDGSNP